MTIELESTIVVTESSAGDDDDSLLREALGMSAREPPATLAAGQILDEAYRIEEMIGEGGMGRVYRARDVRLERDVAIKLHTVVGVDGRQWSLREAATIAQLSHPNVVTVFEVGTWNQHPWVAMEYVRGGTVRGWLEQRRRTQREILTMFIAAGRGLAAANAAGIVHRDFKPDNILVTADGQPRVADFGLALELSRSSEHANLVMGTPAYMAPEQWARGTVGAAADQFAFAVSLWEALTGSRPYHATTQAKLIESFASPPPPPAKPMPRHVEAALRRALSRDPEARWPSLSPLLDELARDPQRTRRRGLALGAASAALVGAGIAVASLRGGARPEEVESPCLHAADGIASTAALLPKTPAMPTVEAWLRAWRTDRTRACEDTYLRRTQSIATLQLRELCFDTARTKVEASLRAIANGADRAALVDTLPPLEDCSDTTRIERIVPLPTEPAARAELAELSATIARIEVLRQIGKLKEADAELTALIPKAEATGRKNLIAEVWLTRGVMSLAFEKREGAREMFETSAKLAAEAGDDKLVARAWMSVLDLLVARDQLPKDAMQMAAVAEAAVLRAGNTPRLRADLAGTLGDIDIARGDWQAARAHYEEAIALHVKAFGETQELARKLNKLATITTNLDDPDAARTHLKRAAELLEHLYGPRFRHLAVVWTTLGYLELRVGNWKAAREQLDKAVALKEEVGGKDSPTLVPTLVARQQALGELGELPAAELDARRAVAIAQKAYGPDHAKVVEATAALGHILIQRADWKGARAAYTEAQRIQRKIGNLPPLATIEIQLAKLALREKRYAEARAAVERARPIALAQGETSYAYAKMLEMSGRVDVADGKIAEGRASLEKALVLLEARRGREHPETVAIRELLAKI